MISLEEMMMFSILGLLNAALFVFCCERGLVMPYAIAMSPVILVYVAYVRQLADRRK